jgi:deoxyribose-phosphate aldolase
MKINQFLDATYLKTATQAGLSEEENLQNVLSLTQEAIKYNYKLLMIRANYIPQVKALLDKVNSATLIGTVIGFHEGTNSVLEKLEEAQKAIDLDVDELDFVLNYNEFKKGNSLLIEEEIIKCTKLCLDNNKAVKWIIETAALTNEEIVVISQRIKEIVLANFKLEEAKSVFIKSSTGFYKTEKNLPNGATLENMQLIIGNAKPLKIKAAGGVRDYQMAKKMIAIGVDRIGTSSAKEIVTKENNLNKSNLY